MNDQNNFIGIFCKAGIIFLTAFLHFGLYGQNNIFKCNETDNKSDPNCVETYNGILSIDLSSNFNSNSYGLNPTDLILNVSLQGRTNNYPVFISGTGSTISIPGADSRLQGFNTDFNTSALSIKNVVGCSLDFYFDVVEGLTQTVIYSTSRRVSICECNEEEPIDDDIHLTKKRQGQSNKSPDRLIAFPNPTQGIINLMLPDSYLNREDIELNLLAYDGRIIQKKKVSLLMNTHIKLNFTEIPSGIYSIQVITKMGTQNLRVIKI